MELLRRGVQRDDLGKATMVADTPQSRHPICTAARLLLSPNTRGQERGATHRVHRRTINKKSN